MRFDIISLMPAMFQTLQGDGVAARAIKRGLVELVLWNPRDYTHDVHRTVDDRPYGGGPGMLIKPAPLHAAIAAARSAAPESRVAFLSPQGRRLDQDKITSLSLRNGIILIAGRYEGIDERIIECCVDEEWSIGDYVLSGGELAAMVLMDAVIRLLPGVLGDSESAQQDSHANGLLDCPHYTRPEKFLGHKVPEVLLSGNHEAIRRWRLRQSLARTWQRRPDLLQRRRLSAEEERLLQEHLDEHRERLSENE